VELGGRRRDSRATQLVTVQVGQFGHRPHSVGPLEVSDCRSAWGSVVDFVDELDLAVDPRADDLAALGEPGTQNVAPPQQFV